MSETHSITFSVVDDNSVVVDRFGSSLQFSHLEFDKKAISGGCRSENADIDERF